MKYRGARYDGPRWESVRGRVTRDIDSKEVLEDIQIAEGNALGDFVYTIPGGQRNILTEFHYVPEEPRYQDMKDGEWKRLWHEFVCATDDAGIRAKGQDYVELFSEPRCVPEARKQGLSAEASFDLSTGWDCRKMSQRK